MVEGDKSVIRVKSKVNTDDITLQDKNGTPIGNKSKNSTPGDKYKGYFEFTDVPVSKIREMFYIRIHNAGIPDGPDDHDETDNINYYDGIYKLVATILSEDVSLKALKIDTSQSGIDYMADHTKFKDGSIKIGRAHV